MDNLNCPNCGAPIRGIECPYCGTVFYDFASIRDDKPTYIRIRLADRDIAFRARMMSTSIDMSTDALPEVDISFVVYPDDRGVMLYRHERRTDG